MEKVKWEISYLRKRKDECRLEGCHLGRQYQFDTTKKELELMEYCPMRKCLALLRVWTTNCGIDTCQYRYLPRDTLFRCQNLKEGKFFCHART